MRHISVSYTHLVVLTYFISAFNLASGAIQVRISEALTILPYFTPAAIPGLFVGCLLANLLTGAAIYDVIFGSLATLLGAVGTYLLRKHKFLCTLAPVVSNIIIIPLVLRYGYGLTMEYGGRDWSIPFYMLTVGAGEIICCCVLGTCLLYTSKRRRKIGLTAALILLMLLAIAFLIVWKVFTVENVVVEGNELYS